MSERESTRRRSAAPSSLYAWVARGQSREYVFGLLLVLYWLVWSFYGVVQGSMRDLHFDQVEQYFWSQRLDWGFAKHPPFAAACAYLWFLIFPRADWSFYFLSVGMAAIALWIAWYTYKRYLTPERRILGVCFLIFTPFYNFLILRYNVNIVLLPLWAATTFFFLRSLDSRSMVDAALAGILAAACMYGKYWSAVLLIGLSVAALSHGDRSRYFRSAAPWITTAAGLIALAPHLHWLFQHQFLPFEYVLETRAVAKYGSKLQTALLYIGGSLAYIAVPVGLTLLLGMPDRATLRDMFWPSDPTRRTAAVALYATLLAPLVIMVVFSLHVQALWTMSAWTLLPVVLLGSPKLQLTQSAPGKILFAAVLYSFAALSISPLAAAYVGNKEASGATLNASRLVSEIDAFWRNATSKPLQQVSVPHENLQVAYYAPASWKGVDIGAFASRRKKRFLDHNKATAIACRNNDEDCLKQAEALIAENRLAARREIELRREWLFFKGMPERFVLFAIVPG